ncbi:hypothetical protein AKJ16_DCAP06606 [Drosera capensis]
MWSLTSELILDLESVVALGLLSFELVRVHGARNVCSESVQCRQFVYASTDSIGWNQKVLVMVETLRSFVRCDECNIAGVLTVD